MIGSCSTIDKILTRIEGEYLEMPGLQLTLEQAQRLWRMERTECQALLEALVAAGFLNCSPSGKYAMAGGARHRSGSRVLPPPLRPSGARTAEDVSHAGLGAMDAHYAGARSGDGRCLDGGSVAESIDAWGRRGPDGL